MKTIFNKLHVWLLTVTGENRKEPKLGKWSLKNCGCQTYYFYVKFDDDILCVLNTHLLNVEKICAQTLKEKMSSFKKIETMSQYYTAHQETHFLKGRISTMVVANIQNS